MPEPGIVSNVKPGAGMHNGIFGAERRKPGGNRRDTHQVHGSDLFEYEIRQNSVGWG